MISTVTENPAQSSTIIRQQLLPNKELKKISIFTIGSRGDVQPYIAVAQKLVLQGYEVRILTDSSHISFVESFGLKGVSMGIDFAKQMKSNPMLRWSMADGDTFKFFLFLKLFQGSTSYIVNKAFISELNSHRPDLLVCGTFSEYYCCYAVAVHHLPCIQVKLQYITDHPERAMWGFPTLPLGLHQYLVQFIIGQVYDSWNVIDKTMVKAGGKAVKDILSRDTYLGLWKDPHYPVMVLSPPHYKEALYSKYAGDKIDLVGASFLHVDQEEEQTNKNFGGFEVHQQLEAFFAKCEKTRDGVKPVYMGWGSMTSKSAETMVVKAVSALQIAGLPGIILGGYAGLSMELLCKATKDEQLIQYAAENVLFVGKVSHESLFPRVSCTVHHGGAGTTNTSLCAGAPTIVTPLFWDQFDNAHVVKQLGVGVGFSKHFEKISATELAEAIQRVVFTPSIVEKAQSVGTKIKNDPNGADVVTTKIQEFWKTEVQPGTYASVVGDAMATSIEQVRRRNITLESFLRLVIIMAGILAGLLYHKHIMI